MLFRRVKTLHVRSSMRGAVMPLLVLLLAALLGVASMVYIKSTRSMLQADLQTAADAASLAASSALCSKVDCFNRARSIALQVLGEHNAAESLGKGGRLEVGAADEIEPGRWKIVDGNLEVQVERGWTHPDDDEEKGYKFNSLEGDWAENHPGLPDFLVANSVRIRVHRPRVSNLLSSGFFAPFAEGVEVVSLAISGPIEPEKVAPFALSVCSLISIPVDDPTVIADFHKDEICLGPRYFTNSRAYCPDDDGDGVADDPECGMRPSMLYGNCDENDPIGLDDPDKERYPCTKREQIRDGVETLVVDTNKRGLFNPGYPNPVDHFGLVGLPGPSANEGSVLQALEGNRGVEAYIGQPFTIVPEGITGAVNPAAEEIIWQAITNSGNPIIQKDDSNNDHIRISDTQEKFEQTSYTFVTNKRLYGSTANKQTTICTAGSNETCNSFYQSRRHIGIFDPEIRGLNSLFDNMFINYMGENRHAFSSGLCPSRRVKLGCQRDADTFDPLEDISDFKNDPDCGYDLDGPFLSDDSTTGENMSWWNTWGNKITVQTGLSDGVTEDSPVFRIKVPVIADVSPKAVACEGAGSEREPGVDPTHEYVIVGFVRMIFSDVAIEPLPEKNGGLDYDQLQAPFDQRFWNDDPRYPASCPFEGYPSFAGGAQARYPDGCQTEPTFPAWSFLLNGLPDTNEIHSSGGPDTVLRGPNPWHFQVFMEPTPCNLVRGRVWCTTDFIPSSINDDLDEPRIPKIIG